MRSPVHVIFALSALLAATACVPTSKDGTAPGVTGTRILVPPDAVPTGATTAPATLAPFGDSAGGTALRSSGQPQSTPIAPKDARQIQSVDPLVTANLASAFPSTCACNTRGLAEGQGFCNTGSHELTFCSGGVIDIMDCSIFGGNSMAGDITRCGYVSDSQAITVDCIVQPSSLVASSVVAFAQYAYASDVPCSPAQAGAAMCNDSSVYFCEKGVVNVLDCSTFVLGAKKAGCEDNHGSVDCYWYE